MTAPSTRVPTRFGHRFDWLMAGLGGLLVYGLYLGLWANEQGLGASSAISIWLVPAFVGFFASIVALLVVGARHGSHHAVAGRRPRHLAPPGYEAALVGGGLILVALIADVVWQAALGEENGIERNLAPPLLVLAFGVALLVAGPLVAGWRRADAAGEAALVAHEREAAADPTHRARLLTRLPQIISLGLTLAALVFLTSFATPATQHWAERHPGDVTLARPGDIWLMAPDGTDQTRLTYAQIGAATYQEAVWWPDGTGLSIVAGRLLEGAGTRSDGVALDLAVTPPDRMAVRVLAETPAVDGQAYRSPDGTRIAFSSQRETLATIPTATPSAPAATASSTAPIGADGPLPGWDPGSASQGSGTTAAAGSRWDIYVATTDGTGERRLTEGGSVNIVTGWARDERPIGDGRLLFHSDRDGDFDVYSMRSDGSDVRQLTNEPGDEIWPAWGPDGRLAVSANLDGAFRIWVAEPDGSGLRRLSDGPDDDWQPAWSPDGATIAFLSNRTGDVEVYAVPSGGGRARNLSRTPALDEWITAGAWSPDGRRLAYSVTPPGPAAADPELRALLAVAAIVVWSAVLAGLVVASVRRGALPLGALTIGLLVAAVPAGLATNEPRVIAAALVAGLVGDLVVRLARPGPGRPRAIWLLGTALPATWAIAYLVAVVNTTGSGLSVHALAGAATLAGLTGLLLAIVATRERRPAPA